MMTPMKICYTILIESEPAMSNTYVFDNKMEAEAFVDEMRKRLYPNYPTSDGSDWAVYHAVENRIFSSATAATKYIVDRDELDGE